MRSTWAAVSIPLLLLACKESVGPPPPLGAPAQAPIPLAAEPASELGPAAPRLELRALSSHGQVVDVYLGRGDDWRNLTNFPHPHHLYDYEVSPNGERAFVWHMDYPPRVVSVYDTRTGARVGAFSPGRGGDLCWTAANTLLHRWGAGTNVRCFAVLAPTGQSLACWFGEALSVSPSRRFLVPYPAMYVGTPIEVLSLESLNLVHVERPQPKIAVDEVIWHGDAVVTLRGVTETPVVIRLSLP